MQSHTKRPYAKLKARVGAKREYGKGGVEKMRGQMYVPIAVGPKRVPGLLADIDMHRIRAGDPSSLSQVANVRRWQ